MPTRGEMSVANVDTWAFPSGAEDYASLPGGWTFLASRLASRRAPEDSFLLMTLWAHSQGLVFMDGREAPVWTDAVSIDTLASDRFKREEIEFAVAHLQQIGAIESERSAADPALSRYRVCYEDWCDIGRPNYPDIDESIDALRSSTLV
jgi:hypothetical protein